MTVSAAMTPREMQDAATEYTLFELSILTGGGMRPSEILMFKISAMGILGAWGRDVRLESR